jgi:hypothetical protein
VGCLLVIHSSPGPQRHVLFQAPFFVDNMSADTDETCIKTLGDFGRWQLRGVLLVALVKVPAAWQMASILFTAPNPGEFWCARPSEFLSWDHREWREVIHPSTPSVSTKKATFIFVPTLLVLLQHCTFTLCTPTPPGAHSVLSKGFLLQIPHPYSSSPVQHHLPINLGRSFLPPCSWFAFQ